MADTTRATYSALRLFHPDDDIELPFTVVNKPGRIVQLTMAPNALNHRALDDERSYRWIHGLRGRVVVDLSRVAMVNSALCSWLVGLMHAAKPSPLALIGANVRVAETLRLLRLDVLMSIQDA
jgi:anti-anti-sigma regulatory factor